MTKKDYCGAGVDESEGVGVGIGVTMTVSMLSRRSRWMFAQIATNRKLASIAIIARSTIGGSFGSSGTAEVSGYQQRFANGSILFQA
jgi:hypothetical protein